MHCLSRDSRRAGLKIRLGRNRLVRLIRRRTGMRWDEVALVLLANEGRSQTRIPSGPHRPHKPIFRPIRL